MTALETYLATHLRYSVWATRRVLDSLGKVWPEEYLSQPGGSLRGLLGLMFQTECNWYELLAGETPPIEPPPNPDWYSIFANLETDYRTLLRRWELLASFLDDLELALTFAHTQVYVPWLEAALPKWQCTLHLVNQTTQMRGQIALLLSQLGYELPQTEMTDYFLQMEPELEAN